MALPRARGGLAGGRAATPGFGLSPLVFIQQLGDAPWCRKSAVLLAGRQRQEGPCSSAVCSAEGFLCSAGRD